MNTLKLTGPLSCDHPRLTCLTFQLYLTMIFRNNCTIFVVLKKSTVIHHDLLLPKPSKWISEIGGKLWKNSIDLNLVSISLRLVQGPAVCPVPGLEVYPKPVQIIYVNLEQNKNESQERKRRLEQEMDIGLAAEQERLIKMEMERQQSELKVSVRTEIKISPSRLWTINTIQYCQYYFQRMQENRMHQQNQLRNRHDAEMEQSNRHRQNMNEQHQRLRELVDGRDMKPANEYKPPPNWQPPQNQRMQGGGPGDQWGRSGMDQDRRRSGPGGYGGGGPGGPPGRPGYDDGFGDRGGFNRSYDGGNQNGGYNDFNGGHHNGGGFNNVSSIKSLTTNFVPPITLILVIRSRQ